MNNPEMKTEPGNTPLPNPEAPEPPKSCTFGVQDPEALEIYLLRVSHAFGSGLSAERVRDLVAKRSQELPLIRIAKRLALEAEFLEISGKQESYQTYLDQVPDSGIRGSELGNLAWQHLLRCLIFDFLDEASSLCGKKPLDLSRRERILQAVQKEVGEHTERKVLHPNELASRALQEA